jgi:hypothetical protein
LENVHLKVLAHSQQLQLSPHKQVQSLLGFHVVLANAVHSKLVLSEIFFLVDAL